LDVLKGMLAVGLFYLMPFYISNEFERTNFMIALGLSAVIGHILPVFADFKGGKGVATLLGMILAIQPHIALTCIGVFLVVLFLTRYVSLSSILGAVMLPICVLWIWNEDELTYRIFAMLVAIMVIITHQKNISRIIKGAENRVPILKYRDRKNKK
jgi:glycerol-3-phosphate acyltransferase PlsY